MFLIVLQSNIGGSNSVRWNRRNCSTYWNRIFNTPTNANNIYRYWIVLKLFWAMIIMITRKWRFNTPLMNQDYIICNELFIHRAMRDLPVIADNSQTKSSPGTGESQGLGVFMSLLHPRRMSSPKNNMGCLNMTILGCISGDPSAFSWCYQNPNPWYVLWRPPKVRVRKCS